MTAQDYPVTMDYGSTDPPYTTSHPHRGRDYGAPLGTPVSIGGQVIGLTGQSGAAIGYHLHVQAWAGNVGNTRDPAPYAFQPGIVANTGTASEWGNFVTIAVNGVNVTYAHLSQINVQIGQKIGENMTRGVMAAAKFLATRQNDVTDDEFNKYQNDIEGFVQYLTAVQAEHGLAPQVFPPMNQETMAAMKDLATRQASVTDAELAKFQTSITDFVAYLRAVQDEHAIVPQPTTGSTEAQEKLDAITAILIK